MASSTAAVHLEQAAQVVGAAQSVDERVGQRARDAGLALHLAAELDQRRVVVGRLARRRFEATRFSRSGSRVGADAAGP